MEQSRTPAWFPNARCYYSEIAAESADPVCVFDATDCDDEVSPESPGTLRLRLESRFQFSARVRVLDAGGGEVAIIRPEGLVPGAKYAMRREDHLLWTLSVRSIVRKRQALMPVHGDSWTLETPFFGVNLTGTAHGSARLLGRVGPTTRYWLVWIEPGRDTLDLLAAVGFLHRQWWRW